MSMAIDVLAPIGWSAGEQPIVKWMSRFDVAWDRLSARWQAGFADGQSASTMRVYFKLLSIKIYKKS